ncbi:hypothetical protein V2K41_16500, partial [Pseudomonas alliivorans]|nr:hypothetical protein [Pseudomonas alliivorans]
GSGGNREHSIQDHLAALNVVLMERLQYDQCGRQVKRTDYTNHGYGNQEKPTEYHSDPHTHIYEYGPGYGSNGKETRINND